MLSSRKHSLSLRATGSTKNDNTTSTAPLGLIARRVCIVEENIGAVRATVEGSNTHTCTYTKQAFIYDKFTGTDYVNNFLGYGYCLLFITTTEQDHKLIATHPRHAVICSDRGLQCRGHLTQNNIAFRVASCVIHRFESVQVNVKHTVITRALGSFKQQWAKSTPIQ